RPTDGTCEAIMWNELGGIGRADSSLPEFDNGKRRNSGSPTMAATAWDSHRRDRFDLQQEIGVGEPAQNAQRAGRGVPGEISLQNAARLRHVVRVADVDRDLGDVGDLGAADGERLGQVRHHHLGLGVEIVGWQHLAVHVRPHLAGAEYELLRALGRHHMGVIRKRLRDALGVGPGDLRHGCFSFSVLQTALTRNYHTVIVRAPERARSFMLMHRLTALECERMNKPGKKPDGGGLYLRARARKGKKAAGVTKSWQQRLSVPTLPGVKRRWRWAGVGPWPDISLAEARELASKIRSSTARASTRLRCASKPALKQQRRQRKSARSRRRLTRSWPIAPPVGKARPACGRGVVSGTTTSAHVSAICKSAP